MRSCRCAVLSSSCRSARCSRCVVRASLRARDGVLAGCRSAQGAAGGAPGCSKYKQTRACVFGGHARRRASVLKKHQYVCLRVQGTAESAPACLGRSRKRAGLLRARREVRLLTQGAVGDAFARSRRVRKRDWALSRRSREQTTQGTQGAQGAQGTHGAPRATMSSRTLARARRRCRRLQARRLLPMASRTQRAAPSLTRRDAPRPCTAANPPEG